MFELVPLVSAVYDPISRSSMPSPLTVLAGFVETMSQLQLSDTERKRVLTLMTTQAQRMQTLVADLLTLAQLEGSPRPPRITSYNVCYTKLLRIAISV